MPAPRKSKHWKALYQNEMIPCACGCGESIRRYRISNRNVYEVRYVRGHQNRSRRRESRQRRVLRRIPVAGIERRVLAENLPDLSYSALTEALKRLREKQLIKSAGYGRWAITPEGEEVISDKQKRHSMVYAHRKSSAAPD